MAKYPYIVVKNDIWYPAGAEVPVDKPVVEEKEETLVEAKEETPVKELEENRESNENEKKVGAM